MCVEEREKNLGTEEIIQTDKVVYILGKEERLERWWVVGVCVGVMNMNVAESGRIRSVQNIETENAVSI